MPETLDRLLDFSEGGTALTLETVLLCILTAFALGQIVAWLYVRTQRGPSFSPAMAQSLVVLATIIALVMLVIGNSLARAFGLFGALALIRFRTPVKDARDTMFLFYALAVGITVGTQNLVAAATGTLAIGGIVVWMTLIGVGGPSGYDGVVRFRCSPGGDQERRARALLGQLCRNASLLHVREAGPATEFAYEVTLRDAQSTSRLVAEMGTIDGVHDLSLLMQREEVAP